MKAEAVKNVRQLVHSDNIKTNNFVTFSAKRFTLCIVNINY